MSQDDLKQKVAHDIESSKDEQIQFLKKLVQTKSANPNVADPSRSTPYEPIEYDVAELIFDKLQEFGLKPKYEGVSTIRPNVVCEFGKGKKTLIFNGHMDTVVPPCDYEVGPYSGLVKDGKLYGVGSWDMKSALSSYVYIAKALFQYKSKLRGKVCLQFVVDEEPMASSPYGTRYLLEKDYTGDAAIVAELLSSKINIGNMGGYRFKIVVFGKSAHTGRLAYKDSQGARNAVLEMERVTKAINEIVLDDVNHPIFPNKKGILNFPTLIQGGDSINSIPGSCTAWGEIRMLPGVTEEKLNTLIRNKLDQLKIKYQLEKIVYVPAVFVDPNEKIVQILKNNAIKVMNKEVNIEGDVPWSDMWMFIDKGIPAVNFGPDGANAHGSNEYVDIKSLIEVTKIYALSTIDFLNT